ncbi:hypothetical protein H8356DRAFT_1348718 [Neocallimastix lanati (nom. inval.)]|nr:hypothetical protein H8356DRAFT_1348718 [Neocallimastix sp. JGI-2020a]
MKNIINVKLEGQGKHHYSIHTTSLFEQNIFIELEADINIEASDGSTPLFSQKYFVELGSYFNNCITPFYILIISPWASIHTVPGSVLPFDRLPREVCASNSYDMDTFIELVHIFIELGYILGTGEVLRGKNILENSQQLYACPSSNIEHSVRPSSRDDIRLCESIPKCYLNGEDRTPIFEAYYNENDSIEENPKQLIIQHPYLTYEKSRNRYLVKYLVELRVNNIHEGVSDEVTMIYLVRHIVEQRTDINKEAINRTTQLLLTYKNWK